MQTSLLTKIIIFQISFIILISACQSEKTETQKEENLNELIIDTSNFPSMRYYHELEKRSNSSKPILLFFNAYGCINCRKTEMILRDSITLKKILNHYHFINLYVDDRKKLKKEEWFKYSEHIQTTIGSENCKLQTELLATGTQPYLAVMKNDSIYRYITYHKIKAEVEDFLFSHKK